MYVSSSFALRWDKALLSSRIEKTKERRRYTVPFLRRKFVDRLGEIWREIEGNSMSRLWLDLVTSFPSSSSSSSPRKDEPLSNFSPPHLAHVSDSCYLCLHRQRRAFTMARISETTGADIKVTGARRAYNKRVTHGRFPCQLEKRGRKTCRTRACVTECGEGRKKDGTGSICAENFAGTRRYSDAW